MNSHTYSVDTTIHEALVSETELWSQLNIIRRRLAKAVKKEDAEAIKSLSSEKTRLEAGHVRAQETVDNLMHSLAQARSQPQTEIRKGHRPTDLLQCNRSTPIEESDMHNQEATSREVAKGNSVEVSKRDESMHNQACQQNDIVLSPLQSRLYLEALAAKRRIADLAVNKQPCPREDIQPMSRPQRQVLRSQSASPATRSQVDITDESQERPQEDTNKSALPATRCQADTADKSQERPQEDIESMSPPPRQDLFSPLVVIGQSKIVEECPLKDFKQLIKNPPAREIPPNLNADALDTTMDQAKFAEKRRRIKSLQSYKEVIHIPASLSFKRSCSWPNVLPLSVETECIPDRNALGKLSFDITNFPKQVSKDHKKIFHCKTSQLTRDIPEGIGPRDPQSGWLLQPNAIDTSPLKSTVRLGGGDVGISNLLLTLNIGNNSFIYFIDNLQYITA